MSFLQEQQFKGPVPGQGMTAEPQSRPWFNPPEISTVEEAAGYYIPRLSSEKAIDGLLDAMELQIPITVLAETLTTAGVMQGVHTIDVATLVNPVLVEFLKGIADNAKIEYDLGHKKADEEKPSKFLIDKVIKENIQNTQVNNTLEKEGVEKIPEDGSVGLMSRKQEKI